MATFVVGIVHPRYNVVVFPAVVQGHMKLCTIVNTEFSTKMCFTGGIVLGILVEQVNAVKAADIQDNITVLTVCFKAEPPPPRVAPKNGDSRLKINRASRSCKNLLKAMEGE